MPCFNINAGLPLELTDEQYTKCLLLGVLMCKSMRAPGKIYLLKQIKPDIYRGIRPNAVPPDVGDWDETINYFDTIDEAFEWYTDVYMKRCY